MHIVVKRAVGGWRRWASVGVDFGLVSLVIALNVIITASCSAPQLNAFIGVIVGPLPACPLFGPLLKFIKFGFDLAINIQFSLGIVQNFSCKLIRQSNIHNE